MFRGLVLPGGKSPPAVRGVGTVSKAPDTTAATPGLPAGTAVGDLLIMFVSSKNALAHTATGWTSLLFVVTSGSGGVRAGLTVLYRIATGTDPTTTDTNDDKIASVVGIQAGTFDSVTPFNATGTDVQETGTTSISITGITTTLDACLVFAANGAHPASGSTGTNTYYSAWANSGLDGIPELVDELYNGSAQRAALGIAYGNKLAAGATGAVTATAGITSLHANAILSVNPT